MTDLAKHTWPEADRILGPDTVVILPIGSTEPHGPHLPLDTDVTIALAQARRAAARLEKRGVRCTVLPALSYGLTNFTEGFAGTVSIRPGTLWAVLDDIAVSLSEQGVQRIVFSNGHLEPAHVNVLRGVILDFAERRPGRAQVVFPDNTRRRWAETLSDEFKSGDCHAGRYEASIVLAADGPSVREDERGALPPLRIDLIQKMSAGKTSFKECGAEQAYCGDPAAATSEEGEELIERLADMIETSVAEAWPDLFA
ncbi:MAG: creatininase family protein [bacterium]|nr:creatininase family protein [bacterium]